MKQSARNGLVCSLSLLIFSANAVPVSDYVSHVVKGDTVLVTCQNNQKVRVLVCGPGVIRVEFDPLGAFSLANTYVGNENVRTGGGEFNWNSNSYIPAKVDLATYVMKNPRPGTPFTASNETAYIKVTTAELTVRINKSPLRILFYNAANTTLINKDDDAQGMACEPGSATASCNIFMVKDRQPNEHFFGFANGCRAHNDGFKNDYITSFEGPNLAGTASCHPTFESYAAPFFYSTLGYGLFVVFDAHGPGQNSGNSYWDMGKTDLNKYTITYNHTPKNYKQYLIYYFINGPQWRTIVDRYTELTGKPPVYRKKYFGVYAVSRNPLSGKSSEDDMVRYRTSNFPLDVFIQEHTANCWPNGPWFCAVQTSPPVMNGYAWLPPPGNSYWDGVSKSDSALMNFAHSRGFLYGANINDYYQRAKDTAAVRYIVDHGFDIYWRDVMSIARNHFDAKTTFNNFLRAFKNDTSRTFIRHGWATWAGQAYGPHHFSDCNPPWTVFKTEIATTLGGFPYAMGDLGLCDRGLPEYSLLPMPYFHYSATAGYTGDLDPKPWAYGQTTQDLYRKWMRFHESMVPYLYTYACRAHLDGMPVWRHMVFEEPANTATYNKDRQAYVGDWLLVVSGFTGTGLVNTSNNASVWIPRGTWYDFWEGTKYVGEQSITYDVSGAKLPLFARAGAIIPMAPEMNYIGEIPEDPLTLKIWPAGSSEFQLWEDETRIITPFRCVHDSLTQTVVSIGAFNGSRWSPAARKYKLEIHNVKAVLKVQSAATVLPAITRANYDANMAGYCYDAAKGGVCFINAAGPNPQGFNVYVSYNGTVSANGPAVLPDVRNVVIRKRGKAIMVSVPFAAAHAIDVLSLQGKVVARKAGAGAANYMLPLGGAARSVYVVKVSAGGQKLAKRVAF